MRRRGIGLGITLVVVALVFTLGMVVASASVSHLSLMTRTANAARADDLARSALALAVEKLFNDQRFGTRSGEDETVTVSLPFAPEGSQGMVSFEPGKGVPVSLNNLLGSESTVGSGGQVVPLQSAHLVAVGNCRGVTRTVEAVLHLPPFPYAVASAGPVHSGGGLEVGAVGAGLSSASGISELKPAHLLTNATGSSALTLGPRTTIKGDLLSSGGIRLDPSGGTKVEGQVLPDQEPRTIPRLRLEDYDPEALDKPYVELASGFDQDTELTGSMKREGDFRVDGDLKLRGALIYVEGDVEVTGALTGSGLLVTTGKLKVGGQTRMVSSDRMAILSRGGIELEGKGKASSNLRGVVYTEGGLKAREIRLEGTLLAQTQGQVQLDETRLIQDPNASHVEITLTQPDSFNLFLDESGIHNSPPPGSFVQLNISMTSKGPHVATSFSGAGIVLLGPGAGSYADPATGLPTFPQSFPFDAKAGDLVSHYMALCGFKISPDSRLIAKAIQDGLDKLQPAPGTTSEPEVITVDPSAILPVSERARVILWKPQ
ncbi:MAG: hypothetical protein AMXMBFR33_07710 [Candidatus Xenobia bacterium]